MDNNTKIKYEKLGCRYPTYVRDDIGIDRKEYMRARRERFAAMGLTTRGTPKKNKIHII